MTTQNIEEIIVPKKSEIKVFVSQCGGVSISQSNWPDADSVVTISRDDVKCVIAALRAKQKEASPKTASRATKADDEWLASLAASPAYQGIDVAREFAKCVVWCENKRKQASRRRFINWLNRVERPMRAGNSILEPRFNAF